VHLDLGMSQTPEANARRAQQGDRAALEELIAQIQGKVYGLALRMLWHPEDAQDATQEILLRVVTHLATFRGESTFYTWVYRITANHLLRFRKSRLEEPGFTFERFGKDLEEGLSDSSVHPDDSILLQEIRVGCTLGMLLCLDRPHRLAYILGEILEMDGNEASAILGVRPVTFRKRLERARAQIVEFMQVRCGLANPKSACRCRRRLKQAVELKRVDRQNLLFGHDPENARAFPEVLVNIRQLEETQRAVALFRTHPEYAVPNFTNAVRDLLNSSGAARANKI
jgi:RNA polymerase sigma factor (sigma-70 family)